MAKDQRNVEAITPMEEDFAKWYTDIVKKAIKDNNLSPKAETIAQAAKEESISVKDEYTKTDITEVYENHSAKKGLSDGAVIAIVFGVIILGFAGLVVLSRK